MNRDRMIPVFLFKRGITVYKDMQNKANCIFFRLIFFRKSPKMLCKLIALLYKIYM